MNKTGFIIKVSVVIIVAVAAIYGIAYGVVQDINSDKEYGKLKYEFVVLDKYDNLGSNWHVIGGRATETEYHIIYRYHVCNRPVGHYQYQGWSCDYDKEVSYSTYKKYNVGDKFYEDSPIFY